VTTNGVSGIRPPDGGGLPAAINPQTVHCEVRPSARTDGTLAEYDDGYRRSAIAVAYWAAWVALGAWGFRFLFSYRRSALWMVLAAFLLTNRDVLPAYRVRRPLRAAALLLASLACATLLYCTSDWWFAVFEGWHSSNNDPWVRQTLKRVWFPALYILGTLLTAVILVLPFKRALGELTVVALATLGIDHGFGSIGFDPQHGGLASRLVGQRDAPVPCPDRRIGSSRYCRASPVTRESLRMVSPLRAHLARSDSRPLGHCPLSHFDSSEPRLVPVLWNLLQHARPKRITPGRDTADVGLPWGSVTGFAVSCRFFDCTTDTRRGRGPTPLVESHRAGAHHAHPHPYRRDRGSMEWFFDRRAASIIAGRCFRHGLFLPSDTRWIGSRFRRKRHIRSG
jgi:hypothetical protein